MSNIFAIIVTWNGMRFDWIKNCLSSLQNSDVPIQIIVIDNASSDDTVDYIQRTYKNIHIFTYTENMGFGAANNLGLEKALQLGGEYFFLLNQDAWVDSDCVRRLVEQSQLNPEYGIISPIHLNGAGDAIEDFFETRIIPVNCTGLFSDFVLNKVKDQIYESGFINAAAWLVTKECLEKVGGFSPVFYHYAEDDNFVHRLLFKKMKIGVYPKVFIYHDKENSKTHAKSNLEIYKRRTATLHLSSPERDFDSRYFLWHLRKEIIKNIIIFNRTKYKNFLSDYIYFRTKTKNIEIHRSNSMGENPFLFLQTRSK